MLFRCNLRASSFRQLLHRLLLLLLLLLGLLLLLLLLHK
jgi:hypothetical protein